MKTVLYNGSRQVAVDTRHDEQHSAAPRPVNFSAKFRHAGKDLYLHINREKNATYYLHLWSSTRTAQRMILPVSSPNAERFLMSKGLLCNLFPKSNPGATL